MLSAPATSTVSPGRTFRDTARGRTGSRFMRIPNTWLDLSSGFGRFGTYLLMAHYFLLLLAPLFWMVNFHSLVPAQGRTTLEEIILIMSGPELLIHVATLIALPGVILLAAALLSSAVGLRRLGGPLPSDVLFFGVLAGVLLILWLPMSLWSSAQASGALLTLDAVSATGGFTVASLFLLLATLFWMGFTLGVGRHLGVQKLTCYHWPVFAALSLLGATAIAASVQTMASGALSRDVYLIGMVLKVTLIPVLGVLAYAVLRDKFTLMSRLAEVPHEKPVPAVVPGRLPVPPPPADQSSGQPAASEARP